MSLQSSRLPCAADVNGLRIEPAWSTVELAGADLADARLDQRLRQISVGFAAQPQASIPQACGDWAATKGAYRFFENPHVQPEQILAPHQQRTCERMRQHALVLAVQDTTYLNYTPHLATQELGLIGSIEDGQVGLLMHSTLAVSPEGVPLGLLSQTIWAREEPDSSLDTAARRRQRRQSPIEAKESYKWLRAVRESVSVCPDGVDVVHVCDSEADIYEMFQEGQNLGVKLVVRASQDRAVVASGRIRALISQRPVSGYLQVEIPARHGQAARTATVEVRYGDFTFRPPYRAPSCHAHLRPLTLSVVWVHEASAPAGVKTPLEWLLVTNVPVHNFDDAVVRVRWYRRRWHIEVFHKVLKSGCHVEDCRLETADKLTRYLTLKSVIAWRLFWMVQINRVQPEAACTVVLAEHEWQALYAAIHQTSEMPETVPTVHQVIRWIAQLGGFLGRKCDGEPGVTVLWRGWHRLTDLVAMWLVLHGGPSVS
jgi:hypothetical protein